MKEKTISYPSLQNLAGVGLKCISLAIGVFDGIHLGHQKLLSCLCAQQKRFHSYPVALTFFPHPKSVVSPENAPCLLIPPQEKLHLFGMYGVKAVVTIPFTKEFSMLSPLAFLEKIFSYSAVTVKSICVGEHWRFGQAGKGNTDVLRKYAADRNFDFQAVSELMSEDEVISSTSIRKAIAEGDLRKARVYLGRPYSLFGVIEHGMHVAGNSLEHPTANLRTDCGVMPPNGVYACDAVVDDVHYRAVCNIGCAPTFDSYGIPGLLRVEVHLLDCAMDLYGRRMRLVLYRQIRPEIKFDGMDSLKEQICRDVETAKHFLAEEDVTWQMKNTR